MLVCIAWCIAIDGNSFEPAVADVDGGRGNSSRLHGSVRDGVWDWADRTLIEEPNPLVFADQGPWQSRLTVGPRMEPPSLVVVAKLSLRLGFAEEGRSAATGEVSFLQGPGET